MNKSKLFPMAMVAFFMYAFAPSTFAQIQVESNGTVKVGSTTSSTGQLNVNTTVSPTALYIYNNKNTSSTKYGLRNNVYSAGNGKKYGMYNYVIQNSSSASTTTGIYSRTIAKGSNVGYGIYNVSSHSGTGTHRGIFNETTGGTSNLSYGIDNHAIYTGTGTVYGINNYVTSTGSGKAFYSYYSASTGNQNYGIYNIMLNQNTSTGKGLYSYTQPSVGEAGHFIGDVYVSGVLTHSSDLATKENIKGMNNALALIGQLAPKSYNYKNIASLNLPEGEQYGFIAQELERVLPTLVKDIEVVNPEELKGEGEQLKEIKSVNYTGLTPILVKAVQEQQDLIQQQQKLIEQLNQRLERLEQK